MIREDNVRVVAKQEVVADGDAGCAKIVHLFQKARRINHDSIGDHRAQLWLQDAGGKQRKLEGLAALDDGMAGVGASVEANDNVMLVGEKVDDLAFGLVAPLQADDTGAGHCRTYSGKSPVKGKPGARSGLGCPQKTPATPKVSGNQSGGW